VLDPANVVRQPAAARQAAQPAPPPKALDREIDPEFLELFIEEAKDEITKLKRLFPLWDENPQDQDSLVNVRRSFHTLKGSGRMVGAQLIGEFAWAVENLLNRVINKTLERSPEMMTLLREAVAAVPELVEQLETGRAPHANVARIIEGLNTIAACARARPPRRARRLFRIRRPLRFCRRLRPSVRRAVRKKKPRRLQT
jgi:chemosensory pili system protein ChpA (sensor histidine kinase/response regulator)